MSRCQLARDAILRRVRLAVLIAAALLALPSAGAAAPDRRPPLLSGLTVTSGARWEDDVAFGATITPNGDGRGDRALIGFRPDEAARVSLVVYRVTPRARELVARSTVRCPKATTCRLGWGGRGVAPGVYAGVLYAMDAAGNVRSYGSLLYRNGRGPAGPIFRVRRVDAYALRDSYAQGEDARFQLAADRAIIRVSILHVGPEKVPTTTEDLLRGVTRFGPLRLDWSRQQRRWSGFSVPVGSGWPSGLYSARIETDDGQVGYAPFVVRERAPGSRRIALVMPTLTWQAYNRSDADADGLPDTWYVNPRRRTVPLLRPYAPWGVPLNLRNYELPLLHWLERRHPGSYEMLADSDLERADGKELARRYDLIVLAGHAEYATDGMVDALTSYRDAGGNLFFTFANSLFWRVDRRAGPDTITRDRLWRDLGRPEAALIGVQYAGNDDGSARAPMRVVQYPGSPGWWAYAGTSLEFGSQWGSFGIEIDRLAPSSPPQTIVLGEVQDVFGPGRTGQMTAYETRNGARVIAAGAYLLARSAMTDDLREREPAATVLGNLWRWVATP